MRQALTLLAALTALAAGCAPGGPSGRPGSDDWQSAPQYTDVGNAHFAVSVQQGGRKIPIHQRQVVLQRGTFDLVFAFPQPDGVFVHASASPDLARLVASGQPAETQLPLRALSEYAGTSLAVDAPGWQYWYHLAPGISKFTDVAAVRVGGHELLACKMTIASLTLAQQDEQTPLPQTREAALHLVFIKTEWNADHTRRVARAQEYLTILFADTLAPRH